MPKHRFPLLALILALVAPVAMAETQPDACTFRRGSDTLDEACLTLLSETADAWKAAKATGRAPLVGVAGYAQEQQGPRLDGLISRRRAAAVAEELERLGIDRGSIEVRIPQGEERDLSARITGHDRRVEIRLGE